MGDLDLSVPGIILAQIGYGEVGRGNGVGIDTILP